MTVTVSSSSSARVGAKPVRRLVPRRAADRS